LDTGKWTYRIDTRFWSAQRAENVSVADGYLRLALKKEKQGEFEYTAGGVISRETYTSGAASSRHSESITTSTGVWSNRWTRPSFRTARRIFVGGKVPGSNTGV